MSRRPALVLLAGLGGCGLVWAPLAIESTPRLLFNTTASVPIGLYWVDNQAPAVGEVAVAKPPPSLARWLAMRRYIPSNVPLIKPVAATSGQTVCAVKGLLSIDGGPVARARTTDHWGRPLTPFAGCRVLTGDEVLLLNPAVADSLDGRYFGPLPRSAIIGRARPIWIER